MREKKLPARLEVMAGFISDGESVADIGADHGYLPLYLVRKGLSPFAILTDVSPGPLEKTKISLARMDAGADDRFELRLGDGLSPLCDAEVGAVVIAGMGGETIVSILAADPAKTRSFSKYVLQPRTKTDGLRAWLTDAGMEILAETAAEEKGRQCDIIVCRPAVVTQEEKS